jgi:parallel beta-helix repeat protein
MKNKLVVVIICALFISAIYPVSGNTFFEKDFIKAASNVNTLYVGGNGSNNYSSIQEAIDIAKDGDTVFVYDDSSPYFENIVIEKSICLVGEEKNTTIIDGNRIDTTVLVRSSNVLISDFTIRNSKHSHGFAGIRVRQKINGGNENTIKNNILYNNGNGVYINSDKNKVYKNTLRSNLAAGVYINGGNENHIYENNITRNGQTGVAIAWTSGNNVTGNTIMKNQNGIRIQNSENTTFYFNKILESEFHNIDQTYSHNSTFYENYVFDCEKGYNFWLHYSCNNNIKKNHISQYNISKVTRELMASVLICYNSSNNSLSLNTVSNDYFGICIGIESYNNTCYMNNISNCTNGINIWTAKSEKSRSDFYKNKRPNMIIKNNFIDNYIHALSKYLFFSLYKNKWDKNFWGKPRNLPKIIFGLKMIGNYFGIPYRFDVDWHPAKEPYEI